MMLSDYGKLIILSIGLVGAFAGMLTNSIDDTVAVAIIGPIIGYITGNGVLATTGKASSALIVAKENPLQD